MLLLLCISRPGNQMDDSCTCCDCQSSPCDCQSSPCDVIEVPTAPVLVPVFSMPGWRSELTACAYVESLTALLFVRCHSLSLRLYFCYGVATLLVAWNLNSACSRSLPGELRIAPCIHIFSFIWHATPLVIKIINVFPWA